MLLHGHLYPSGCYLISRAPNWPRIRTDRERYDDKSPSLSRKEEGERRVGLRVPTIVFNRTSSSFFFLSFFPSLSRFRKKMWSSVTAAGTENGPAPPSRSKHSATLLAGHVYLLGGRNGNLPLKDIWRYSLGKREKERTFVHCPSPFPCASLIHAHKLREKFLNLTANENNFQH